MVDLKTQNRRLRELQEVVGRLAPDVPEKELHEFVTTTYADAKLASQNGSHDPVNAGERQQDSDGLAIYDELPDGLIDVQTASKKYGRPVPTLHSWIRAGHLRLAGRLKAPARGGGFSLVFVSEVESLLATPPRRGRPPT